MSKGTRPQFCNDGHNYMQYGGATTSSNSHNLIADVPPANIVAMFDAVSQA